jgi:hypothetical protein
MSEWLKTVIASGIGGIISGGFLLLADYLRHRRTRPERYEECLVEKRIKACDELMRLLLRFWSNFSPIQKGVEPLRLPKNPRICPNHSQEQLAEAKQLHQDIADMSQFVQSNEMFLGPQVVKAWQTYFAALMKIKLEASLGPENDGYLIFALTKLMPEFFDKIAEAIKAELCGANIEFLSTLAVKAAKQTGHRMADALLKEAEQELSENGNAKTQT